MSNYESEIERLKRRIKQEQATLKQKEKAHQEKLAKQLGKYVLRETHVTNLTNFQAHWKLVKISQLPATKTGEQLEKTLRQIADQMTYTGRYWKIENLTEVSAWLAKFRTPESQA